MAYCGHIVCKKCRRTLYLGKYKDDRFWPGTDDEAQVASGVLLFLSQHFPHGDLLVLGDVSYERYLDSLAESEWPITVYLKADESGTVRLTEELSISR